MQEYHAGITPVYRINVWCIFPVLWPNCFQASNRCDYAFGMWASGGRIAHQPDSLAFTQQSFIFFPPQEWRLWMIFFSGRLGTNSSLNGRARQNWKTKEVAKNKKECLVNMSVLLRMAHFIFRNFLLDCQNQAIKLVHFNMCGCG